MNETQRELERIIGLTEAERNIIRIYRETIAEIKREMEAINQETNILEARST